MLSHCGRAFSCGSNSKGQLGLGDQGDQRDRHVPTVIATLESSAVVQVVAGCSHSLFVSVSGQVYTCGYSYFGQLGLGPKAKKNILLPTAVQHLQSIFIVQVVAGAYHSLFLAVCGAVFSCGYGRIGNLESRARRFSKTGFAQEN